MTSTFGENLRRLAGPILPEKLRGDRPVVPVVRLQGAIGIGAPFRPPLTLASAAPILEKAFAVKGAKEIALILNSPGGSPVQAHLIYKRIRALAEEKEIGVSVFVEDVAASGGYMIACAADEIVVDPSSIVGSIGVVSSGFGFDKAIARLGIDRRLYTSGDNKAILDPFQPEKADDVERLKEIQREVHDQFISLVKERRRGALSENPDLFTGLFWTGSAALGLGLVDRIGDLRSTMRERWGDRVELRPVSSKQSLLRRITGRGGESVATAIAEDALAALESRAMWSRYGL